MENTNNKIKANGAKNSKKQHPPKDGISKPIFLKIFENCFLGRLNHQENRILFIPPATDAATSPTPRFSVAANVALKKHRQAK